MTPNDNSDMAELVVPTMTRLALWVACTAPAWMTFARRKLLKIINLLSDVRVQTFDGGEKF